MRRLVTLVAFCLAALPAATVTPAMAAPHEWHICPAEARGAVSHTGDASWTATSQSSRLVSTHVGPIGGIVALVCVYRMFGADYWIYKRPSPDLVACRPDTAPDGRRGFYCGRA